MIEDKMRGEMFWVDRWRTSSAASLPIAARGLYRELLSAAWVQGASLPSDPVRLQRIAGVTAEEWAQLWPMVSPYWDRSEDGQSISNATQVEVYQESLERRQKLTDRATKAAQSRWATKPPTTSQADSGCLSIAQAHAQALPKHMLKQCPQDQDQDQEQSQTLQPTPDIQHNTQNKTTRRTAPSTATASPSDNRAGAEVAPAALDLVFEAELFDEPSAPPQATAGATRTDDTKTAIAHRSTGSEAGSTKPLSKSALQKMRKQAATKEEHLQVCEVFGFWADHFGFARAKLDQGGKRYNAVLQRLRDGYTTEELALAIEGNAASPFHRGQNDQGTTFHELALICRDTEHVDKFIAMAEQQAKPVVVEHKPTFVRVGDVAVEQTGHKSLDANRLAAAKWLSKKTAAQAPPQPEGGAASITDFRPQVKEARHAI